MLKFPVSRTAIYVVQSVIFLFIVFLIYVKGGISSFPHEYVASAPWYFCFTLDGVNLFHYRNLLIVTAIFCSISFVIVPIMIDYFEKQIMGWGIWLLLFWLFFFLITARITRPMIDY
jgi:hypothetical protein